MIDAVKRCGRLAPTATSLAAVTEIALPRERPAGAPRPRLGYAMVTAAAALFAVNGAVSKLDPRRRAGSARLRLTELRATGRVRRLRRSCSSPRPRRLRIARDELAAARLLRRRRLRARPVALLRRDRAAADRDRPPARVHGAGARRALGAARLARARAPPRVGRARARARRASCSSREVWEDVRLDAVGVVAGLLAAGALATYYLRASARRRDATRSR